jgi:peptide/nickel transport system permease protein
MADPAVTIDEGVVLAAGGQAEQRVAVATQWQLMWWRFRKHRLALGGTFVLVLFYLVSLFADFFAYTDPNESEAQRSLIAPQSIHWFDDGSFRPYVYGLKGARDPLTFKRMPISHDRMPPSR